MKQWHATRDLAQWLMIMISIQMKRIRLFPEGPYVRIVRPYPRLLIAISKQMLFLSFPFYMWPTCYGSHYAICVSKETRILIFLTSNRDVKNVHWSCVDVFFRTMADICGWLWLEWSPTISTPYGPLHLSITLYWHDSFTLRPSMYLQYHIAHWLSFRALLM